MNWDAYKSWYKALERSTLRGGVIGLVTLPWFGVAAGLLGVVASEYPVSRPAHAAMLGLDGAMSGFVMGAILGAIFGAWKHVALHRPTD